MGMEITGQIRIVPPLNAAEVAYLSRFNATRRMARTQGPYFVFGAGPFGQYSGSDVIDRNTPPSGQPSLWCGWKPTADGTALIWDGKETFHCPVEWMSYLIEHFLTEGAHASTAAGPHRTDAFDHFTFDHTLAGRMEIAGPDGQRWDLLVDVDEVEAIDQSGRGVPGLSVEERWEISLRSAPNAGEFLGVVRSCLEQRPGLEIPWIVRSAAATRATALGLPLDAGAVASRLHADPEQDTDALFDLLTLALGEQRAEHAWNAAMVEMANEAAAEDAQIQLAVALGRIRDQIRIGHVQLSRLTEGEAYNADYADGVLGEDLAQLLDEVSLRIRAADALDRTVRTPDITTSAQAILQDQ